MALTTFFTSNFSRTAFSSYPLQTTFTRTFAKTASNINVGLGLNPECCLYILGKRLPVSKNTWDQNLLREIPNKFSEVKVFTEKEKGIIFGHLSDNKNIIMFKGATPLEAVEDLKGGLNMIDTSKNASITAKVYEFSEYIIKYIRDN